MTTADAVHQALTASPFDQRSDEARILEAYRQALADMGGGPRRVLFVAIPVDAQFLASLPGDVQADLPNIAGQAVISALADLVRSGR